MNGKLQKFIFFNFLSCFKQTINLSCFSLMKPLSVWYFPPPQCPSLLSPPPPAPCSWAPAGTLSCPRPGRSSGRCWRHIDIFTFLQCHLVFTISVSPAGQSEMSSSINIVKDKSNQESRDGQFFSGNTKIWLDLKILTIEIKDRFTSIHHLDLASRYLYYHN